MPQLFTLSDVNILVLSLGSTGLSTIERVKGALSERTELLSGSRIRFLALDDEWDIFQMLSHGILSRNETFILPNHKTDGTRIGSRLRLTQNPLYQDVRNKLEKVISTMEHLHNNRLEIHFITGSGGYTSSGLCVDIPYLVRSVAKDLKISQTYLFGHIYLPDVFNGLNMAQIYHNGYAALAEIDQYMNIAQNGKTFDALYPDGAFSSDKNIFDFCTLIGRKNGDTGAFRHDVEMAINACAENLINQILLCAGNQLSNFAHTKSLLQHFFNQLPSNQADVMRHGIGNLRQYGNYKYTYIGFSTLTFPADTVNEYLSNAHFQKMIEQMQTNADSLTQADVEGFSAGTVSPEEILHPYLLRYHEQSHEFLCHCRLTKKMVETDHLRNQLETIVLQIEKDFHSKNNFDILLSHSCSTVLHRATQIFCAPKKGPLYLARILTAHSRNGGIAGYYEMLDQWIACYHSGGTYERLHAMKQQYLRELRNVTSSMMKPFCFGKFSNDYKDILRRLGQINLEIRLYDELFSHSGNYQIICHQIRKTLDKHFLQPVDVIHQLGQFLRHKSTASCQELAKNIASDSIFSLNHPKIDALKNSIEHYVTQTLNTFTEEYVQTFLGDFTTHMMNHPEQCESHLSGSKIDSDQHLEPFSAFINTYEPFQNWMQRDWFDYMNEAFATETTSEKKDFIQFIENHLEAKASPLFQSSPDFSQSDVQKLSLCFTRLPAGVGTTWGSLFNFMDKHILLSPDPNAIYHYTMYIGLPFRLSRCS